MCSVESSEAAPLALETLVSTNACCPRLNPTQSSPRRFHSGTTQWALRCQESHPTLPAASSPWQNSAHRWGSVITSRDHPKVLQSDPARVTGPTEPWPPQGPREGTRYHPRSAPRPQTLTLLGKEVPSPRIIWCQTQGIPPRNFYDSPATDRKTRGPFPS